MLAGVIPVKLPLAGASYDADLVEAVPGADGTRLQLALLSLYTNDFSVGFGEFTEVDSAANVAVSGGKLLIRGSGAFDVNGVRSTALVSTATPGKFKIVCTPKTDGLGCMLGFLAGAALDYNEPTTCRLWMDNAAGIEVFGDSAWIHDATRVLAVDTAYIMEFEWTTAKEMKIWITGGVYTSRTLIALLLRDDLVANIGFCINAFTAWATQWEFTAYERFGGFSVAQPPITLAVRDSGVPKTDWDLESLSFPGATAGIEFAFGVAEEPFDLAYGSYRTLAQIQSLGRVHGRYFGLRPRLVSAGSVQRVLTEGQINACLTSQGIQELHRYRELGVM